ncbi:DYHC1-like protein [Mya arenaria]|uniref:DYHC1-like protein n=1 Tax=Mya arenaria TaxID=6604 RepID=A0ABY7FES6_MYAAR|nr:DYHC1-like protein [Mya arenaria]
MFMYKEHSAVKYLAMCGFTIEKCEHFLLNISLKTVKSIKKKDLVEIRSMANPPQAVKNTLESICLLLGENSTDWKSIRGIIVKDDFISKIVGLNTDDMTTTIIRTSCENVLLYNRPIIHGPEDFFKFKDVISIN